MSDGRELAYALYETHNGTIQQRLPGVYPTKDLAATAREEAMSNWWSRDGWNGEWKLILLPYDEAWGIRGA